MRLRLLGWQPVLGGKELTSSEDQQQKDPASNRSVQSRCQYPNGDDLLNVVGRHCRLSHRSSAQKNPVAASVKTLVFAKDKPVPGSTGVGSSTTQKSAGQSGELSATNQDSQGAESQTSFEVANRRKASGGTSSEEILEPRKKTEADESRQMKDILRQNDSSLDTAPSILKEKASKTPNDKTLGMNSRVEGEGSQDKNNKVEDSSQQGDIPQTNQRSAPKQGCSSKANEDQRAFFIDIATGDSCTIQSLSAEAASFRRNRTLILRQLLSQQKIDDAASKSRISPLRPAQKRTPSQRRVRNAGVLLDTPLLQAAGEGKHRLPILPNASQSTRPILIPESQSVYFDTNGSLRSDQTDRHHRGADLQHYEGLRQGRLRCQNAGTRYHLEHATEEWSHEAMNSDRASLPTHGADETLKTRTRHGHTASIDSFTHHCSGHHRCVRKQQNNSQHLHSHDARKPDVHTHTVPQDWTPSILASHHNNRQCYTCNGGYTHPVPEHQAGSISAVADAPSAELTLVPISRSSKLLQACDTGFELRAPVEFKQEHLTSKAEQTVVKESGTLPIHPNW